MATVLAAQAATTYPVYKPEGRSVAFLYGVYEIASALSKDDIVGFCYLPACSVVEGFLRGDDLDTGAEALELDVGHNGDGTTAADADAFLNSGVITGDAITDLRPAAGIYYPFQGLLPGGPIAFVAETRVQAVATAAATSGGTGTLYCGCFVIE